jgi:hypothetical protein
MLKRAISATAIATAFAMHFPASGQTDADKAQQAIAAEEQTDEGQAILSVGGPVERPNAGFAYPTFEMSQNDDEAVLSLGFSLDVDRYGKLKTDDGFYRVRRTQFSVVGSTPIGEGDNPLSSIFAKDDLVRGAKVKASFSILSNTLGSGAGIALALLQRAYDKCVPIAIAGWPATTQLSTKDAAEAQAGLQAQLAQARSRPDFTYPIHIPAGTTSNEQALATHVRSECEPTDARFGDERTFVEEFLSPQEAKAFRRSFFDQRSRLRLFGVDGTFGQNGYEYLDRAAFELSTVDKTAWEVGAYAGIVNSNATFAARLRGGIGRSFELPNEAEDCRTVEGLAEPKCLKGPDGPPVGDLEGLISLETRHFIEIAPDRHIGLAPQATYLFDEDNLVLELPVYLTPGDDGVLSGGIKFGYESKEDDFAVGLFVGVPLDRIIQ